MEPNIEFGDLIVPQRDGLHLGVYLVVGIGPTTGQLSCRNLSSGPLGETHTFWPKEVLWAWKPSYNRLHEFAKAIDSKAGSTP